MGRFQMNTLPTPTLISLESQLRNLAVEAIWLPTDICNITLYGDYSAYDLPGVQIHPLRQTYGGIAIARYFLLHGPEEVIAEVEVQKYIVFWDPVAITVSRYLSQAYLRLLKIS